MAVDLYKQVSAQLESILEKVSQVSTRGRDNRDTFLSVKDKGKNQDGSHLSEGVVDKWDKNHCFGEPEITMDSESEKKVSHLSHARAREKSHLSFSSTINHPSGTPYARASDKGDVFEKQHPSPDTNPGYAIICPYKGEPRPIHPAACAWHRKEEDPECKRCDPDRRPRVEVNYH